MTHLDNKRDFYFRFLKLNTKTEFLYHQAQTETSVFVISTVSNTLNYEHLNRLILARINTGTEKGL